MYDVQFELILNQHNLVEANSPKEAELKTYELLDKLVNDGEISGYRCVMAISKK